MLARLKRALNPPVEQRGYTDILTQAILNTAVGDSIYCGALEVAAGTFSRAMATAVASGPAANYFTAPVMSEIGRDLIESGESVWRIMATRLVHIPSAELESGGRLLHLRYSTDVNSGRGVGPLGRASALNNLANNVENSLAKEAGGLVGYVLPVPKDGNAASITQLKADLKALNGRTAVVETTSDGWGEGRMAAPSSDYSHKRIGPDIPMSILATYKEVNRLVLAACGIPTELLDDGTDGNANREAWRRFLHSTIQPLGEIIKSHAAESGLLVDFSFEALFASDITGRARAFGSLVAGGMDVEDAANLTGLISEEEG